MGGRGAAIDWLYAGRSMRRLGKIPAVMRRDWLQSHSIHLKPVARQGDYSILTRRRFAPSSFGRTSSSTPSLSEALAFSVSTALGRGMEREIGRASCRERG